MSRRLIAVLGGVAALVVALVLGLVFLVPPAPPVVVPSPNGYEALVVAGKKLRSDDFAYDKANDDDLRTRLRSDQELLAQLRSGLALESRVPPAKPDQMDTQLQEVGSFKGLARVLEGEARLAILEERFSDAAKSGLDIVRLAHASTRGGPIIYGLVGVAIENRGLAVLEQVQSRLDAAAREQVVRQLRQIHGQSETAATVLENEKAWVRQVHGAKGSLLRLLTRKQLQATETRLTGLYKAVESRRKVLLATMEQEMPRTLK